MNLEDLTPEDRALLETQFSPEVEKLASANIMSLDCVEALQDFGAAKAEVFLLSHVEGGDVDGAMEKHAAAAEGIEGTMKAIRALNFDVECEYDEDEMGEMLEKEATAAAHAIAVGYFNEMGDALEQNPELVKFAMKAKMKAAGKYVMDAGKKAYKNIKDIPSALKSQKDFKGMEKELGKRTKAARGKKAKATAGQYADDVRTMGYRSAGEQDSGKRGMKILGGGALAAGGAYGGKKAYDKYK